MFQIDMFEICPCREQGACIYWGGKFMDEPQTENDITFEYPVLESGRFGFNDYIDFVLFKHQQLTLLL